MSNFIAVLARRFFCMAGCHPRKCDHHCARVCRQFVCTCDYQQDSTNEPNAQRICCPWELMHKPRSHPYAYTGEDARVDTLTRYFGVERSLRDSHDPVRFTGINHVPMWLHADLSSLDADYSNILREREIMAASRYFGRGEYYNHRSIRPHNAPPGGKSAEPRPSNMSKQDEDDVRRGVLKGTISAQALRNGQMPYLD